MKESINQSPLLLHLHKFYARTSEGNYFPTWPMQKDSTTQKLESFEAKIEAPLTWGAKGLFPRNKDTPQRFCFIDVVVCLFDK